MKAALAVVIVSQLIALCCGYGEDFSTGQPTYESRAFFALANALRSAPKQYVSTYAYDYPGGIGVVYNTTSAPSVAPIYFDYRLYGAAALLANDIGTTPGCKLTNSLCNGTTYNDRITYYYGSSCLQTGSPAVTEPLIASQNPNIGDARMALSLYLCSPDSNNNCQADASGQARFTFVNSNWVGGGGASSAYTNNTYGNEAYLWATDLGTCPPPTTAAIAWGSHFIGPNGNLYFIAVWDSSSAPSSATVTIDGATPSNLVNSIGTSTLGTYVYSVARYTDGQCHSYYFSFTVGTTTYRFPDTGLLYTYDTQNNCKTSFVASSSTTGATSATSAGTGSGSTGATATGSSTAAASTTHKTSGANKNVAKACVAVILLAASLLL